jgi:AcrR family transcriptional regulator
MASASTSLPVRDRMLKAAKQLFALRGYENTSTVAIARAAGTSESQLMKYFGSKEGLLEAIFDQGWAMITERLQDLEAVAAKPEEKVQRLLGSMLLALEADPLLKQLMLLEGRRIRKEGHMILMTQGFRDIISTVDRLLQEMQEQGHLKPGLNPQAVRSALVGTFEGLLRDQVLAQRTNYPASYESDDIRAVFNTVLGSFMVH